MGSLEAEEIVLEPDFQGDLVLSMVCECGDTLPLNNQVVIHHHSENLKINFVVSGWECLRCQSLFATQDIMEKINRIVDSRLVSLGARPAVNPKTVKAIKLREEQARVLRIGYPSICLN